MSNRQRGYNEIRNLEKTKIIWAHEYGHVIFNSFLSQNFKPFKEFETYMKRHDEISIKNRNPYAENFQKIKNYWTLNAEKARNIHKAFPETFADLIAVLYTDDLSAMRKAMKAKGMGSIQLAQLKFYDFNAQINNANYKGKDEHFVLASTKAHIGKYLLNFPKNDKEKKRYRSKSLRSFFKRDK